MLAFHWPLEDPFKGTLPEAGVRQEIESLATSLSVNKTPSLNTSGLRLLRFVRAKEKELGLRSLCHLVGLRAFLTLHNLIGPAILANKTVSFGIVKPLYLALNSCHFHPPYAFRAELIFLGYTWVFAYNSKDTAIGHPTPVNVHADK